MYVCGAREGRRIRFGVVKCHRQCLRSRGLSLRAAKLGRTHAAGPGAGECLQRLAERAHLVWAVLQTQLRASFRPSAMVDLHKLFARVGDRAGHAVSAGHLLVRLLELATDDGHPPRGCPGHYSGS